MKRQHTLLILLAASALAQAKDCASDDSVLNEAFAALNSEDEATVATANDKIRQLLREAAAGDNWDCDYPQAQEQGLSVRTSDDHKFRAYSWDDHNGGTARYYLGLWQYRDGSGKTHIINANWSKGDEEGGNSGSVTDLYTAQLDGNGTVYLLEESEKGSSRDYGRFNGHTQVNATDLKLMKYPSRDTLTELGKWAMQQETLTQEQIDAKLGTLTDPLTAPG